MQATRQKVTQLKPYQESRSPPRARERKTVVKSTKLVIPDPPIPKKIQKPAVKGNASVPEEYNRGIWLSPSKKEQADLPQPLSPKTPSSEEKKEYVRQQIKKRTAELSELKKIRQKEEEIKRERLKALRQKQLQLVRVNVERSKQKREAQQAHQEQISPKRSKNEEETEKEQMESRHMEDEEPTHRHESVTKEVASYVSPEKGEADPKEKEPLATLSYDENNKIMVNQETPFVPDTGAAISAKLKHRVEHLQKALQELKEAKSENTPRNVTVRSEIPPTEEELNFLKTVVSSHRTDGAVRRKIIFPGLHDEPEEPKPSSVSKKVIVQLYPPQSAEEQEKWSPSERNLESPRNKIKYSQPEKSELNILGRKTVSDALKELMNRTKTEDSTENKTEAAFKQQNLKFQLEEPPASESSNEVMVPLQTDSKDWLKPSHVKPCSNNITTAIQNTLNSMLKPRQPYWIQTNQDTLKNPEQNTPVIDASKIRRKSVMHHLNEKRRRSLVPSEDDTDAQSYISTTTDYNSSSDEGSVKLRKKLNIKSAESLLPDRIFPEESLRRHSTVYIRRPKKRPKSLHSVKPKTSEEIESMVMNRIKKEAPRLVAPNVTLRRRCEREQSPPVNTWNSHTVQQAKPDDVFPETKYVNKLEIGQQTEELDSSSKHKIGDEAKVSERLREVLSGYYERNQKKPEKSHKYSETAPGMSLHPAALHFQFQSQLNLLDSVEESRHQLSQIETLLAQNTQVRLTEENLPTREDKATPLPPAVICDAETQTSEKKAEETHPQKAVQVKLTSENDKVSASTQTLEPAEDLQPPVRKQIPSSVTVRESSAQTSQTVEHKPVAIEKYASSYTRGNDKQLQVQSSNQMSVYSVSRVRNLCNMVEKQTDVVHHVLQESQCFRNMIVADNADNSQQRRINLLSKINEKYDQQNTQFDEFIKRIREEDSKQWERLLTENVHSSSHQYFVTGPLLGSKTEQKQVQQKPPIPQLTDIEPPNISASLQTLSNIRKDMLDLEKTVQDNIDDTATDISLPGLSDEVGSVAYSDVSYSNSFSSHQKSEFSQYLSNTIVGDAKEQLAKLKESLINIDKLMQDEKENCKKRIQLMNERFILLKEKAHSDLKLLAVQMKKHKDGSREHSGYKKKQEMLYKKLQEAKDENYREYNKLLKDTTARKATLRQQKMLIRDFLKNLLKNQSKKRSEEEYSSSAKENKQSTSEASAPVSGIESSPLEISEHLDVADDQATSEDHESSELDQLYAASDRATSEIKDLQARVKSLHSQLHRKRTEAEALTEQWKTHLKLKEQSLLKKIQACDAYISKTKCELLKNKSSSQNGETSVDSPAPPVTFLSKDRIQEEKDSSSADVLSIPADTKVAESRFVDKENVVEDTSEKEELTREEQKYLSVDSKNTDERSKESSISPVELNKQQKATSETDSETEHKIAKIKSLHDRARHLLDTENIMQWLQNVNLSYTPEITTPKTSVPKLSPTENGSSKDEIETASFVKSYLDSASSVKTATDNLSYRTGSSSLRSIIGNIREALENASSVKSSVKDLVSDQSPLESTVPESVVENGSSVRSIDEDIPTVNDVENTSVMSPKEEISTLKSASENIPTSINIVEIASSIESASNASIATSTAENGVSVKHITDAQFNNASVGASDASSIKSELEVHSNKSIVEDNLSVVTEKPSLLEDGAKDIPLVDDESEHISSVESVSQKTSSVKDVMETEVSSFKDAEDYSKGFVASLSRARNDIENIPSVEFVQDEVLLSEQHSFDQLDQSSKNISHSVNTDIFSEKKVITEDSASPNLNSTSNKGSVDEDTYFKKSEENGISTESKNYSMKSSVNEDTLMETELNNILIKNKDLMKSSLHEDILMEKEITDISTKSKDSVESNLYEDKFIDEELNDVSTESKNSMNSKFHEDMFTEKELNKDVGEAKTSESAFYDSAEAAVNGELDINIQLFNKFDTEGVAQVENLNINVEQSGQQKLEILQKVDKTADKFLQKIIDESLALHGKNRSKKKNDKILMGKNEEDDLNNLQDIIGNVENRIATVEKITDSIFENILKDTCSSFPAKRLRKTTEDGESNNLLAAGSSVSSPERNGIDVRKRVHEILVEMSPTSTREKSRLQDFMITTYDISPPEENNSQPGSPCKALLDGNRITDSTGGTELQTVDLGAGLSDRDIEAIDNESFTQEWFDDDYGLNHTRREAEELRLQQLQIEQEIQQLEQAQEQQVPYFYIREIPNKPPPPYTPPGQTPRSPSSTSPSPVAVVPCISKDQFSHFIPSSAGEVISVAAALIDHLYSILQINGNLGLAEPPAGFYDEHSGSGDSQLTETQILSKRIYKKLIFDLIKDLINEIYNFNDKNRKCAPWEWPAFSKRRKKPPPRSREMLQDIICKQVLTLFGFAPKAIKEKFVIRWSRKKRDYVDEILMKESQEEESSWTNYDEDETFVKNEIATAIFDSLIDDTVQVLKKIFGKKYDT